jgi:protein-histidine N-methyltransferase
VGTRQKNIGGKPINTLLKRAHVTESTSLFSIQVGCGTAVPSCFILQELFNVTSTQSASDAYPATLFHLQDYNRSVLELMTVPNIILTWCMSHSLADGAVSSLFIDMSPLALAYRSSAESQEEQQALVDGIAPHAPGELSLTPAMLNAFCTSLAKHDIHLRFFVGSWEGFNDAFGSSMDPALPAADFAASHHNLVLTSETIYRTDSLSALLRVLREASLGPPQGEPTESGQADGRAVDDHADLVTQASRLSLNPDYLCLVAAKVLYFGVGGGVQDFVEAVQASGHVERVWERKEGVGRTIMKIVWEE